MKLRAKSFYTILFLTLLIFTISGCSVTIQKGRRSDLEKIESLTSETDALNARLAQLQAEKSKEISELDNAKILLEKNCQKR